VLVVHHSGKDLARGARGHSSLRAASDTELEVTKGEGGSCLAITKSRDEEDRARFGFRLEPVELGVNAKGRAVTTCVAVETEVANQAKKVPLTPKQSTVLDCLNAAIADHGQDAPLSRDIPRKARVVQFARWREAALRYLPGDKEDWRKREDFNRIAQALQAKHLVRHVDGWCWPTPAGADHSEPSSSSTSQTSQTDGCEGRASRARPSQTSQNPLGLRDCEGVRGPGGGENGRTSGSPDAGDITPEPPAPGSPDAQAAHARDGAPAWDDPDRWRALYREAGSSRDARLRVLEAWAKAAGGGVDGVGEQVRLTLPVGLRSCLARNEMLVRAQGLGVKIEMVGPAARPSGKGLF
jgi:hypothetical protein